MKEYSKSKVTVLLSNKEHEALKNITAKTRRTLGQELAYRAFSAIALGSETSIDPPAKKEVAA